MKNFRLSIAYVAVFTLVFASCSQDEVSKTDDPNGKKSTLSFGMLLTNIEANRASSSKAHLSFLEDVPDCSDDEPAYVEIVLSQEGEEILGEEGDPFRIDLVPGQDFTEEIPELQLEPGDYSLDYFTVYNMDGEEIWIAPRNGELSDFVDSPLPLSISLGAGVKKYVEVDVLCYDDRFVNEYGYLFFDIDENEAIKFCVFGNYCPPEGNGRHYSASYSVNVWMGSDNTGTPLYTDTYNETGQYDNGDYYAEPLCFALPNTEDDDEYYFEITLRSSDAYGEVDEVVIREGVVTDVEVMSLFDGEDSLDYYHFREGDCSNDDTPPVLVDPDDEAETYKACLYQLNDSGVVGVAYFSLLGNQLTADIVGLNMVPNQVHPQHIHGFEDKSNSTCPPDSAADDDPADNLDFISIPEGAPFYGGVLLSLTEEGGDFPTADAMGRLIYQRTFTLGQNSLPTAAQLSPLENRSVVLHGMNVEGVYEAPRPAACSQVLKNE